jgi:uncharacterized OsmC-like protein
MSAAVQSKSASTTIVNGVDTAAIKQLARQASAGGNAAQVGFAVATQWRGGVASESRVDGFQFNGRKVAKEFTFNIDEPCELGGGNAGPNPQEVLMAAFNSCMLVGYVAGAAMRGVRLESLTIESSGQLDLRGFLGLDPEVKPGYEKIHYVVRIKGDGTPQQFREIHENVIATSPNRWTIANPVKLSSDLIVE